MTMKTFSKWFSIGAALLALTASSALASDASADGAVALQAMRGERKPEVSKSVSPQPTPTDVNSGGNAGNHKDCCLARSNLPSDGKSSGAEFTDHG